MRVRVRVRVREGEGEGVREGEGEGGREGGRGREERESHGLLDIFRGKSGSIFPSLLPPTTPPPVIT